MLNAPNHKRILVQILSDIYSDSILGPLLGFKGGTAAYLFYGLDRFSVDLDFDVLDATKEDMIFVKIKAILEKYGTVKDARKKRFNLFFLLSYDQRQKNAQNIKIEINRRDFGSHYDLKSYMGISMLVMSKEDMFAHKLVAMRERLGKTNRDIYDVWFFSKQNWEINKEIVEKRTGIPWKKFLLQSISALEHFDDRNILHGMGELLTEKQKNWVRTKLRAEAILLLTLRLESEKE